MDKQLKNINKEIEKPEKEKKDIYKYVSIVIILLITIILIPTIKNKEISIKNSPETIIINLGQLGLTNSSALKNKDRINLLFLGVPGQGNSAPELTDTIIIINSDVKGKDIKGISIPRDLFVKYENYYTRINALYKYKGIELIKQSLKEITGLEFDYYIVLDLQGVEKIIDKLKGLDIYVEQDIYDPKFPNQENYEIFSLEKGNHLLNGETVLKYLRSRNQQGGDFSRIQRQQQVINALKDKILSLNPIFNFPTIISIWNTINKHTKTNIGLNDLKYIYNLAKKNDFDKIEFHTLDTELLIPDVINQAQILKPKAGLNNYEEIKKFINEKI
ncbi:LCP family protein [Patescibacteria group bacterium]|nr:LCP family protein [Patescibacteria group bacterium]